MGPPNQGTQRDARDIEALEMMTATSPQDRATVSAVTALENRARLRWTTNLAEEHLHEGVGDLGLPTPETDHGRHIAREVLKGRYTRRAAGTILGGKSPQDPHHLLVSGLHPHRQMTRRRS